MATKYDSMIDTYAGEIPRSLVLGLIAAESNFKEAAVNRAADAPGGGPKVGLMQPSRTGLKDALQVDTVDEGFLKNPVNNIRVGCTILTDYLQRLRRDWPGEFSRPLDQDANAAAILVHAYTNGYATTANLIRSSGSTNYRTIANKNPGDRGIARKWPDRVLTDARKYGYTQILPAGLAVPSGGGGGGAFVPSGGGGSGGGAGSSSSRKNMLPWIFGAAAVGGLAFVTLKKKKARAR